MMAPLIPLFALFSLFAAVLASPHIPRHAYNHHHRALDLPQPIAGDDPLPIPRRKRSLNKRCHSRPSNASTPIPSPSLPFSTSSTPTPTPTPTPPPSNSLDAAPSLSSSSSPPPVDTPSPSPWSTSSTSSTPLPTPSSYSGNNNVDSSTSSTSNQPSYLTGQQHGQGTYYETGLGACGITNNDSQHIAAVSHLLFDSYPGYDGVNPNSNPLCNRQVTVTYQGKSIAVTLTDRCEACAITDLDLSPSAFNTLADPSVGRINISWSWN